MKKQTKSTIGRMKSKLLFIILFLLSGCCTHKKTVITFYDNGTITNATIQGDVLLKFNGKNITIKDVIMEVRK